MKSNKPVDEGTMFSGSPIWEFVIGVFILIINYNFYYYLVTKPLEILWPLALPGICFGIMGLVLTLEGFIRIIKKYF